VVLKTITFVIKYVGTASGNEIIKGVGNYIENGYIYSITGQIVKSGVKGEKNVITKQSGLQRGIYILRSGNKVEKFVVQ